MDEPQPIDAAPPSPTLQGGIGAPAIAPPEPPAPSTLPLFFQRREQPFARYVVKMGALSLFPSLALAALLGILGLVDESNGPKFEGRGIALFLSLVVIAPVVETLLMAAIFWFLKLFTRDHLTLALLSTAGWAVLHSVQAPAWGFVIAWPFFIFSSAYLTWREVSWPRAFGAACGIHMLQNSIPGLLLMLGADK